MSLDTADVVDYPPEFAEKYASVLGDKTIGQELRATAQKFPDNPALLTTSGEHTYAELDLLTDRVALGLQALGLEPGERILLQITNQPWSVFAWYGIIKAGLVPVATLAFHRQHELYEIARQCEPAAHLIEPGFPGQDLVELAEGVKNEQPSLRVLLTLGAEDPPAGATAIESLATAGPDDDAEAQAAVDAIQDGIAPDSVAALQLSGGTTSIPKLIPRRQAEYWYNSLKYAEGMQLGSDGCVPHLLPLVHNAGIVCGLHAAHAVGACFAVCQPPELFEIAKTGRATHMMIAPPLAQMIEPNQELRDALRSLKVIIWVLSKPTPEVLAEWATDGVKFGQMFGQSEGLCMITPLDASEEVRHKTVGRPLSELDEVRVLKPDSDEEVAPGEQGELGCRGPYTIRGYYRAPERNAEAFTSDGFYRTGDIVVAHEIDGETYYSLEDRIKDLINRGGEKVNALEIEGLLIDHPAIAKCALVAMPDERMGEKACAFIVPAEGQDPPTKEDLQQYLDGLEVAKYKWPERVEIRDDLPLTNISKVDKKTLRADVAELLKSEG